MALDSQHKRVRKNRVSITYDVETLGALETKELPFVVGIVGNFSGGKPDDEKKPVEDRQFTDLNKDNFNAVMKRIGPKISIKVDNTLEPEGDPMACDFSFNSMSDFEPGNLIKQVPVLEEMIQVRNQLLVLLSKADRSRALEQELRALLQSQEQVQKLAQELGVEAT